MTQLSAAVTLGCVTLVDATGHEHPISVTFCTSFQVCLLSVKFLLGRLLNKFFLATQ
jgi:hypothetical protein